ncbi:MAG: RNA methyltransferase [Planctomycetaceae bacterium]|nr:RNA methyltransferase [Planctomycetaceae bacterium]
MPRSYLFLFNVAKKSNFGYLIRTANAFGAEIILIGKRKYSSGGAVAGTRLTPCHHFYSFQEGVAFARQRECQILGIEIMPQAKSIGSMPFQGSTAFILGNEGTGLEPWQTELCDDFVYIPQYGTAGSLNINVAAGICLQRFAEWAAWPECPREGHQYVSRETTTDMHFRYREQKNRSE